LPRKLFTRKASYDEMSIRNFIDRIEQENQELLGGVAGRRAKLKLPLIKVESCLRDLCTYV
jgi:hypothetical protein